jgi:hypothetical protein
MSDVRELTISEIAAVAGGASTSNSGFDINQGQGNLNNNNVQNNPGTVTESGPKGVLKNGNTDNPNYTLTGPGRSNG